MKKVPSMLIWTFLVLIIFLFIIGCGEKKTTGASDQELFKEQPVAGQAGSSGSGSSSACNLVVVEGCTEDENGVITFTKGGEIETRADICEDNKIVRDYSCLSSTQLVNGCPRTCVEGTRCEKGKCVVPCTPKSCGTNQCEIISDGCNGIVDCGSCVSGKVCQNNFCVTENQACTPTRTACDFGLNCGTQDNGCGIALPCGTCPSGYQCLNNVCSLIIATCGNGVLDSGEQCDDGNQINNDACKNDCTTNICGDGAINNGVEQCDDKNTVSGDGCSSTCQTETKPICGNGIIESGEQCDDKNTVSGDGCSSTCQTEAKPVCGNGIIESGEQCDDGNTINGDGCSSQCTLENNNACGDNQCDSQMEDCNTCPQDCGSCQGGTQCGDNRCDAVEQCGGSSYCAADCGQCGPVCGDQTCDYNEDCNVCSTDCGSCSSTQCSDGLDNDGDGSTDYPNDPGCSSAQDATETSSIACDNGLDDDNDGLTDYKLTGGDPGCSSSSDTSESGTIACDNGKDDDNDGLTDYKLTGGDPGCSAATDTVETSFNIACDNGLDDDNDGFIDCLDSGCRDPNTNQCNPSDTNEAQ